MGTVKKNANSERDRIVSEPGTFKKCQEAFDKFLSIDLESMSTKGYTKCAWITEAISVKKKE